VVVHSKPDNRAGWDPNGRDGWYIGPSPRHYCCVKCFIPATRAEISTDTVVFFPKKVAFPRVSTDDYLKQAALDIITILNDPPKHSPVPTIEAGDTTKMHF
jgi:hypothetical protein